MRALNKNQKTQAGNTIVEVLIALAIIGLVLAGAYATANRSVRITQQTQERTNATKIAEQQLESLRSIVVANGDDKSELFSTSETFCINDGSADSRITNVPGPIPPDEQDAILASGAGEPYPNECVQQEFYHISVDRDDTSADNPRFIVQVRWNRLGGGVDQVKYIYGISEGN